MTGADIAKLLIDKVEQQLMLVGKQRLDDNADAQLRLSLRSLEASGWCDFTALPAFLQKLAENLVLVSTIGTPKEFFAPSVRLCWSAIYFTARHYEDMIESGRIVDNQALLRVRITDGQMKEVIQNAHRDGDLRAGDEEVQEGGELGKDAAEDPQRQPAESTEAPRREKGEGDSGAA